MIVKRLLEVRVPSAGWKKILGFTRVDGMLWVSLWLILAATTSLRAVPLASGQVASSSIVESDKPQSTRYGLFDWLDHRSAYGQGVFPEPFLVDDSCSSTKSVR